MAGTAIKTKLVDDVANLLRKNIIEGVYPNGHHLNETALAREFSISRGPIREAINLLEADGMVYTPGNGRTLVLKFDGKDFDDYVQLRFFLEFSACKKIMTEGVNDPTFASWLANTKQDLRQLESSVNANLPMVTNRYDFSLHDNIMERSESVVLIRAWRSLSGMRRSVMETNLKYSLPAGDGNRNYFEIHADILKGIESGDLNQMENALRVHFGAGKARFSQMLEYTRPE